MIWTALAIGFVGSLHCLGMCSPLAMAVTNLSPSAFINRMLYNLGRILTYGIMGAMVSLVGATLPILKMQNLLSIILGLSLLIIGISGVSSLKIPIISRSLGAFSIFLKQRFGKLLQHRGYSSTFLLGSLNGILPCGLSFLALAYCISLRGPVDGFFFMMGFGVGTLPVMLGLTTMVSSLITRFHFNLRHLTMGMLIASGLLLIARVFIVHFPQGKSLHEGVTDIVLCR